MATEVEMKLAFTASIADSQLDVLASVLSELNCNSRFYKKVLKNAYFDTPDFSLNQHKVALRIRQSLSDKGELIFIQTFKTAGKSIDGLSQRGEWEWTLAGNKLAIDYLQSCEAWPLDIAAESLVTIFETNFERYTFDIQWENSHIELVLDWGDILSNNKQEKIHEIELELKKGHHEELKTMAQALMEKLPLHLSDISKAERGVNLFNA